MLKSTLNSRERNEPKRPTLPHLFKDTGSSMVVLFTGEREGVVVREGNTWGMGQIGGFWVSCWDTNVWAPLKPGESVTITVESEE